MSNPPLDPLERRWEQELRSLRPASAELHFDALSFEAGRRVGRRQARPWQAFFAAIALALACLPLLRLWQPPTEKIVYVPVIKEDTKNTPPAPVVKNGGSALVFDEFRASDGHVPVQFTTGFDGDQNYLALRNRVLAHGLSALPPSRPAPASPPTPTLLELHRQLFPDSAPAPTPAWNLSRFLNLGAQS